MAFIPWPGPSLALVGGDCGPARLYLVEAGAALPPVNGCLEDWVRLPAPDGEVSARAAALLNRLRRHQPASDIAPYLDTMGVLHAGPRWVDLPPLEARLFGILLDHLGEAVGTEALLRAGWGEGFGSTGNLRIKILRLRRRLADVDFKIHTLPGRGYMLARGAPGPNVPTLP